MNRSRYLFVAIAALVAGAQMAYAQKPADHNRRNTVTPPAPAATGPTVAKELTVKARLVAGRPKQSPTADQSSQLQGRETNQASVATTVVATEAAAPEQPNEQQVNVIKKPSAKFARRGKRNEIKPSAVEQLSQMPIGKIEAPISDEPASLILALEIIAPTPIINASLSVNAKEFKERQAITIQGRASAEFNLPDDFNEPKINYTLTDASGKTLITGEFDLEALRMEDSVRISEVKFDQTSYAPGQSARIVVTLEGLSPYGYLLEVTARDMNGSLVLDDSRRGIYNKGKSIQEFRVEIPAEAKWIVAVEFKASGNLTKKLFDSGSRDIIVNNDQ